MAEPSLTKDVLSDQDSASGDTIRISRTIRAVQDASQYKKTGRTIVVCLDGTGDQFDADNSNIVHLVSCLKKSDPSQVTYYQSGIGTYDGGGMSGGFNSAWDSAVGSGLGVHVRDAYMFLMENYKEGDKICLFGFSRGAYTARCVAGMVHKVGLLPAHNRAQVAFAYKHYKDDTEEGWKMSRDFKRTFCMNVNVYMVGVFDSVASVGFLKPRKLPLSSTPSNKAVYFRHAMSLDERRAKFKACRFQTRLTTDAKWKVSAEMTPREKYLASLQPETDVLEVWFTGCHCDVGGGAVGNEIRHKLAQIPLRWMIRQCFEANTGILFKAERLIEEGLDVHTLSPVYEKPGQDIPKPSEDLLKMYESKTLPSMRERSKILDSGNERNFKNVKELSIPLNDQTVENGWLHEREEDYFDSLAGINDMLAISKGWWVLEVLPIKIRIQQNNSDEWVKKVRPNMGRSRAVQEQAPNLHWSVKHRMDTMDYKTKIRRDRKSEWNIVW